MSFFKLLANRAHRNLWENVSEETSLWLVFERRQNADKLTYLITEISYKCSCQLFPRRNGCCCFQSEGIRKSRMGSQQIILKREKLNVLGAFWCWSNVPYNLRVMSPCSVAWVSPNLNTGSLVTLDQIHWFPIESVEWAPFQASSCSKIFQLVEINPIEVPLNTNQMRLDCNWGKL